MKTIALYLCASPFDGAQIQKLQARELREYAGSRGWAVAGEYFDQGSFGSKGSRPRLTRLISDARRRAFDAVLVWKLDRFGRSLRHLIGTMAELSELGMSFVSLRDGLELGPDSPLHDPLVGALAEFERSRFQERVRVSLRKAKREGRSGGRRRVAVDKSEVLVLRESGASWRDVAKKLGVGLGTAHRAIGRRSKNVCG